MKDQETVRTQRRSDTGDIDRLGIDLEDQETMRTQRRGDIGDKDRLGRPRDCEDAKTGGHRRHR